MIENYLGLTPNQVWFLLLWAFGSMGFLIVFMFVAFCFATDD